MEELLARVDIKNNIRTASNITQLINYVNSYVFPCDKIDGIQRYSRSRRYSRGRVEYSFGNVYMIKYKN